VHHPLSIIQSAHGLGDERGGAKVVHCGSFRLRGARRRKQKRRALEARLAACRPARRANYQLALNLRNFTALLSTTPPPTRFVL
jgi:hypothetical protein